MYQQGKPYCIQIELTEGCNLRCSFCGLNGIRGKDNDYRCMTPELASEIALGIADAAWNPRIEFAMHGEPTMNPDNAAIVEIFRKALPRAYLLMESNGGGLLSAAPARIGDLFNSGLNTLALDQYEGISLVPKIQSKVAQAIGMDTLDGVTRVQDINVFHYPQSGPPGNPHRRTAGKRLVFVYPISQAKSGTHSTLNNHAGAGAPLDHSAQGKRCAKPFREMSVRWDGGVAVCCNDWRGVYKVGTVPELTMEELWHHPRMYAARRKLYHGQRDFGPCNGCNATSYRPGLLPDQKGKEDLALPDLMDKQVIEQAMADGPMTIPVLRPWEQKGK